MRLEAMGAEVTVDIETPAVQTKSMETSEGEIMRTITQWKGGGTPHRILNRGMSLGKNEKRDQLTIIRQMIDTMMVTRIWSMQSKVGTTTMEYRRELST